MSHDSQTETVWFLNVVTDNICVATWMIVWSLRHNAEKTSLMEVSQHKIEIAFEQNCISWKIHCSYCFEYFNDERIIIEEMYYF